MGDAGRDRGIDDENRKRSLIAAALARWPDMLRYASTARTTGGLTWCPKCEVSFERDGVVTVTVFEKKGERE